MTPKVKRKYIEMLTMTPKIRNLYEKVLLHDTKLVQDTIARPNTYKISATKENGKHPETVCVLYNDGR